ncbi:Glycosyltransferase involved in cell wall bisynthesis [Reichenbachiella agariperforans]|uniref:Glycosyltransferase involved in cell wall bisynthesis n=1 Tax=Reichenbachiella agariperforans TaxID=156994 RepID=A0A1M6NUJ7_REIAG|nr:glycosyltransferase family 4 protein [Reichenbachiella agariperforans]SHJ99380.1 Glycosyltransferase involved in cell wall bisynthesis [Reichenbachiella agariperforans]
MRVLHINESDTVGGAARAAYRLHRSLIERDIDSLFWANSKSSDDHTVVSDSRDIIKFSKVFTNRLNTYAISRYSKRSQTTFSAPIVSFNNVRKIVEDNDIDIIHLHWVPGMFEIRKLAALNKPVVWSLHDMWPFTGGCHYTEECEKYKRNCGSCKVLGSTKNIDLSSRSQAKKAKDYVDIKKLVIVGLSKWIAQCAIDSSLFKGRKIVNLPNPIDSNIYKPLDKQYSRSVLGIPENKKLVVFGAMNSTGDKRKGFDQLVLGLNQLSSSDLLLGVFGSSEPERPDILWDNIQYFGQINDDVTMAILLSAADVVIVPSLQENLSNVIVESMACGTPVVSFDIGGNKDIIDHKENGYLAVPFDPMDLATGISWVLANDSSSIKEKCLEKTNSVFDGSVVVQKYIDLYSSIVN